MNIIRDRENLGQSIDNNNQSSKKVKLNHDRQHQRRIDEHYESLNINNSKVQMANQALVKLFVCCGIAFI